MFFFLDFVVDFVVNCYCNRYFFRNFEVVVFIEMVGFYRLVDVNDFCIYVEMCICIFD